MTTRYVWSGATGAGTGADWTNAYTALQSAVTAASAGDDIRVAHDHAETASSTAKVTYTIPGTLAAPTKVVCVNRTTGDAASTAEIKTVGAWGIDITAPSNESCVSIQGIKFIVADGGGGSANLGILYAKMFRDCTFELRGTGGAIQVGYASKVRFENCWVKTANASSNLSVSSVAFEWAGGGVLAGSAQTILFNVAGFSTTLTCSALDLSGLPTACVIFNSIYHANSGVLANCKLPASWAETSLVYEPVPFGSRYAMINCDVGNTNYNTRVADTGGKLIDETAIYRTDGFKVRNQAGTLVGFALKSTTNSSASETNIPLPTDALLRNYPGTPAEVAGFSAGAAKTVSVEIAHSAGAALTDAQIWLEVQCLGTSGFPLGVVKTNRRVSPVATAAAHPTSTEAWSGAAQTYKQRLSVTINPQAPGVIEARVYVATGNNVVVYIDPMITVS